MSRERHGASAKADAFTAVFPIIAERIVATLGERPFHLRGRLNSSALDAVFATLINASRKLPKDLGDRYTQLKDDKEFSETTFYSTSDLSVVKRRFEAARTHLVG